MASRGLKIKELTENETLSSFDNWRQTLLYSFSLDPQFSEFLAEVAKWEQRELVDILNVQQSTTSNWTMPTNYHH